MNPTVVLGRDALLSSLGIDALLSEAATGGYTGPWVA